MNWTMLDLELPENPKLVIIADEIRKDENTTLGLLVRYFCWLNKHFSSGSTQLSTKQVDKIMRQKNFANSLIKVGWASLDEKGCFFVESFDTYNGESSVKRYKEAQKKRKQRGQGGDNVPSESLDDMGQMSPPHTHTQYIDNISSNESILSDPQKQSKDPLPETADSVLTYIASLPSCGLVGQELATCAQTFFDRSEAVGWTINGQPIRDWRAAARAYLAKWQGNNASQQAATRSNKPKITYRSQTRQNYDLR